MTNRQRIVMFGLAAVTVVIAAVIAATSGGKNESDVIDTRTETVQTQPSTATTQVQTTTTEAPKPKPKPKPKPDTTVDVRNGKPVEGVETFRYRKGSTISFTVRSDAAGEVHLHGYDVSKDVEAGGSVKFSVPAKIDGRFEVEIEDTQTQIATVEVIP